LIITDFHRISPIALSQNFIFFRYIRAN
jgi:hypothetical protein